MRAAIGKPGERARMIMDALTELEIAQQLQPGEVMVQTGVLGPLNISADGKSVSPVDA